MTEEYDSFDVLEGICWFCINYHEGQSSYRYQLLSNLDFNPGPISTGPSNEMSQHIYDHLVEYSKQYTVTGSTMVDIMIENLIKAIAEPEEEEE